MIFHKVKVPGPLLGRDLLWFDSCNEHLPLATTQYLNFGWLLTGGSTVFDTKNLTQPALANQILHKIHFTLTIIFVCANI